MSNQPIPNLGLDEGQVQEDINEDHNHAKLYQFKPFRNMMAENHVGPKLFP
jgi:hypothetical protein